MTRRLVYGFIFLASAALTVGFWRIELVPAVLAVALAGFVWVFFQARGAAWVSSLMFFVFAFASAAAIYVDVHPWLSFTSLSASLVAWDLTHFSRRLSLVGDVADAKRVERVHFGRVALVVGLGALGYFVTQETHINLTFASAAILAFLAVWGISALISSLRKRE